MKHILNISNIYLLLVVLLQLQEVLYEGGSMISKAIIAAFMLSSIAITIHAITHIKMPYYFSGLLLLLGLFTIYGTIHIISSPTDYLWSADSVIPSYNYLLSIYKSLLPIFVFYYATVKGEFRERNIQFWTIVILIASIARFWWFYIDSTDVVGVDEITNNFGYLFVGIIPLMIFFYNKPIAQYVLLGICMIFVTLSMKRGAVFVAICSLVPIVISLWKQSHSAKRIVLTLMIIAFIVGGIYFIQYMLYTSDYFLQRISDTLEGDSSLRNELYAFFWNHFVNDTSITEIIFGGGANYTMQIADNVAHNDWLEILINQGIIGVVIYTIYWKRFLKTHQLCKNIPELDIARSGLTTCLIASFLMTIFSMSYGNLPIGMTMTLGICLGQITLYQTELKCEKSKVI